MEEDGASRSVTQKRWKSCKKQKVDRRYAVVLIAPNLRLLISPILDKCTHHVSLISTAMSLHK